MHTWFIRLLRRSFSNHLLEELCSIESRSMQMMWSSFGGHQQVTSTSHLIYYSSLVKLLALKQTSRKAVYIPFNVWRKIKQSCTTISMSDF